MSYLTKDFLLTNETAKKLYFGYAEEMPIFDYHCHLSEKQILENEPFSDLFEIWLAGDHYKWRLMRNYGVPERYITGDATNKEKFMAYCKALGTAFGNPLYHWSQVELKTFFACDDEINEQNAERIWESCNAYIRAKKITPQKLIESSNVTHLFTTNEVFDDLSVFEEIAKKPYRFRVIPAFRADALMGIGAKNYNALIDRLGKIDTLDALEAKIEERLLAFLRVGTCASDISLQRVAPVAPRECAAAGFEKRRAGEEIDADQQEAFRGYLTYFLMKLYAKYDIRTELHIGAMRDNNSVMFEKLGANTGYDSIAEDNSTAMLSRLFDRLNSEGALPRTILFNLNPKMNLEFMALLGCFQDDSTRGKIQYGPAWWFLDNKSGMERHLYDLTATGHLGAFVGMLTDSRSLLSYPRHHYFRRILCNFLGTMIENGEMTADLPFVGEVVRDVSYRNAIAYFGVKP